MNALHVAPRSHAPSRPRRACSAAALALLLATLPALAGPPERSDDAFRVVSHGGAAVDPCASGTPLGTVLIFREDREVIDVGILPLGDGDQISGQYGSLVTGPVRTFPTGAEYYCGGDTPGIATWGNESVLRHWTNNYDDLVNVAYTGSTFMIDITYTFSPQSADHRVALYGFDLGGWDNGATTGPDITVIPSVTVLAGNKQSTQVESFPTVLASAQNVAVGAGGHVSFDFNPPLMSPDNFADFGALRILVDLNGVQTPDYVGIDNIHIAQTGIVRFASVETQVLEDATEALVTVERTDSGATEIPASVLVQVSGGDATLGTDIALPAGTSNPILVSWAAGDNSPKVLRFPLLDDQDVEGDETLDLTLVSAQGVGLGQSAAGPELTSTRIVIQNDDTAGPSGTIGFVQPTFTASESAGTLDVVLERMGSGAASVTLQVADGSATNGNDFNAPLQTQVDWSMGDPEQQVVQIPLIDDGIEEQTERFSLALLRPVGATLANASADAVILDDDFSRGPTRQITTSGAPVNPHVVYGPNGEKAVVWIEASACPAICFKVMGQYFDADDVPRGGPFEISREATSINDEPVAAFTPDGQLFVVWPRRGPGAAKGAPEDDAVGKFLDPQGEATSEEIVISEDTQSGISKPDVEVDKNGEIVVVWEDGGGVRARFLDRQGVPRRSQADVGGTGSPQAERPALDSDSSGRSVIVFEGAGGQQGLFARRYADDGKLVGSLIRVETDPAASNPDVAARDDGGFVVVYELPSSNGVDIVRKIYDENGDPATELEAVNLSGGIHREPQIDINAGGDFVVVWRSGLAARAAGGDLVGRFFDPGGEPATGEVPVAEAESGSEPTEPSVSIDDDDEATVVYQREGPGGASEGIFRTVLQPSIVRACAPGQEALCLQADRFEVRARWQDFGGTNGPGRTLPLTSDSGTFWFFSPDNIELIVKVLDACAINGHFWMFAAGLTDVEVELLVDDTAVGLTRSYFHSSGSPLETIRDVQAFPCQGSRPASRGRVQASEVAAERVADLWADRLEQLAAELVQPETPSFDTASSALVCQTTTQSLCLNGSRFSIDVDWATAQGTSGVGMAQQLTDDSGYFWFFSADNVELIFKVLDGCSFNDHYWVFGSGLTDVQVTATITDTQTGATMVISNPQGQGFTPVRDIQAFSGCP